MIKYVNHMGEEIILNNGSYKMLVSDLLDYEWEIVESNEKISGLKKKLVKKILSIDVIGSSKKSAKQAQTELTEIFEKDVMEGVAGKLYFENYYLKCFVYSGNKSRWETNVIISCDYGIVTDYPFWISETTYNFYSYDTILSSNNKNYPGRYPYRYANGLSNAYIQNPHFIDANFDLIIYGPAVNPQVTIGETPYLVNIVLEVGEYLKIDSRAGTVTKVMANGEIVNAFHNRQKGRRFFKKIPPGRHSVSWPGTFAWDLIIYEERSEPKWNVSQQQ